MIYIYLLILLGIHIFSDDKNGKMDKINERGGNIYPQCEGKANCGFTLLPGMIGFWPLDLQNEGKNLVAKGQDFTLIKVKYQSDDGRWKSAPALFPSGSQGVLSSSSFRFGSQQSFSWMTAFKFKTRRGFGYLDTVLDFNSFSMMYHYDRFRIYRGNYNELPAVADVWHTLAFVAKNGMTSFYVDGKIVSTNEFFHSTAGIKINVVE